MWFQLPFVPCLGSKQASICVLLTSRVPAPHSPLRSPTGSPTSQGASSSLILTSGLGCPIYGSNCSLPRVDLCSCNLHFPLSPLQGAQVLTWWFLFPSYLNLCGFFLQLWWYRNLSASLQVSVRIVPHVDVFLMCFLGEVSSVSSYSAILILPPQFCSFLPPHFLYYCVLF